MMTTSQLLLVSLAFAAFVTCRAVTSSSPPPSPPPPSPPPPPPPAKELLTKQVVSYGARSDGTSRGSGCLDVGICQPASALLLDREFLLWCGWQGSSCLAYDVSVRTDKLNITGNTNATFTKKDLLANAKFSVDIMTYYEFTAWTITNYNLSTENTSTIKTEADTNVKKNAMCGLNAPSADCVQHYGPKPAINDLLEYCFVVTRDPLMNPNVSLPLYYRVWSDCSAALALRGHWARTLVMAVAAALMLHTFSGSGL